MMRTIGVGTSLILVALSATTVVARTFDRGKVERFATLPAGEAHPEGIAVDGQGNVYVVTVALDKPVGSPGSLIVFDPGGRHLRTVRIADSSRMLIDLRFHPRTGRLLTVDYEAGKVLAVDPVTGASSVFMTVAGDKPGLDAITFDDAGNVYVTDAHHGIIWRVGQDGGEGVVWFKGELLTPKRVPPPIGANGLVFNGKQTALFVANTSDDTVVKIPVAGVPLAPGRAEIFASRVGGGPDGLIVDDEDNLWVACNQSDEVVVLEPTTGRVIAKLGDFGGIDRDGAPVGFLWSNSLVFVGDEVLVTNLALDARVVRAEYRTTDSSWAAEVKLHTISKIKKRLPGKPR